jgi:pimeloyl-ACP methyl ester carboxylesterase
VTSDDYPIGIPVEVAEARVAQLAELWGTEASAAVVASSRAGDQRFRRWYAKLQRTSAGPRAAQALLRALLAVDVRPILPLAQAPMLVLHRRDVQFVPVEHSRYLAKHIPGARLVELPGADMALVWESQGVVLDLLEEFLTGVRRSVEQISNSLNSSSSRSCTSGLEIHSKALQRRRSVGTCGLAQRSGAC